MKLPYREGSWIGVPLRQGGFAVGVVARATNKGKVILCYFFGPCRTKLPVMADLEGLTPSDAVSVVRVGDLSLVRGEWPIIGQSASWRRSEWPMPPFLRRDDLSHKAWRVQYSDADPNAIDYEEPAIVESKLDRDAVLGAGAAEILLTKLLA